jgi:SAM-dependent methyltransferase
MSLVEQIKAYWDGVDAADRSYPPRHGKWPDADHVAILQRLCTGAVCEVGCGTGRCSEAFQPQMYCGVDINRAAILKAQRLYPEHKFLHIGYHDPYPPAETYLFHTCLMHVPDEELDAVLLRARAGRRVVIFESMMSEYNGGEFNFQRDVSGYEDALMRCGFDLLLFEEHPTKYQTGKKGIRPPLLRRFMMAEVRA